MFSQLNSFTTYMGLPDTVFLSQKDTQFPVENECSFLFRTSLELQDACQIAPVPQEERVSGHDQGEQREAQRGQGQEQDRSDQVLLEVSSSLKVKLPSVRSKEDKGQEQDRSDLLEVSSSLKVKLPAVGSKEDKVGEEEGGCKTPTSTDQKIPMVCPPPPRKAKMLPSANKKGSRTRVLLDLSDEIESLFPPALLADFGNKIKKVRKESFII